MQENNPITGQDLVDMMEELEISVNCMAFFLDVDRNTIGSYKRKPEQPLPRQRQMRILLDHLKGNSDQVKADFEKTKQ